MKLKLYTIASLALLALAASHVHAADNPLHPTFYWATANGQAVSSDSSPNYGNANDPLHPTYQRGGAQWQSAKADVKSLYVDQANPLYPGYKR
jgi:hypothetical protein